MENGLKKFSIKEFDNYKSNTTKLITEIKNEHQKKLSDFKGDQIIIKNLLLKMISKEPDERPNIDNILKTLQREIKIHEKIYEEIFKSQNSWITNDLFFKCLISIIYWNTSRIFFRF